MIIGAEANEHFPTSTMPVGVVFPPVPTTTTAAADDDDDDTKSSSPADVVKMTPYDIARQTAQSALDPNGTRARFRLEMVQYLHQWTLGMQRSHHLLNGNGR